MTSSAPTIGRLLSRLRAPAHRAAADDPGGLQLGDAAAPARRIGVCHEVTADVVDAAVAAGLDLLVTYHPLLHAPTVRLVAGPSAEGRAWRLASAGVAVAVVHTAFDAAPGGTADALAAALGLRETRGFGPLAPAPAVKIVTFLPAGSVEAVVAALAAAGAGVIGEYSACSFRSPGTGTFTPGPGANPYIGRPGIPEAVDEVRVEMLAPASREAALVAALRAVHPYEEPAFDVYDVRSGPGLVGRVGETDPRPLADFGAAVVAALGGARVSGRPDAPVGRVAVVPGSGAAYVADALAAGADVLVTGDVSHHRIVSAVERGLAVVDPGHAPTERPGMAPLVAAVAEAAGGADIVDLTGFDPTPWHSGQPGRSG